MPVAQSVSITSAVRSRPMPRAAATSRSYSPRVSSRPAERKARLCVRSGFTRQSARPMTAKNLFSAASMAFTVAAESRPASCSRHSAAELRLTGAPPSQSPKRRTSRTYFSTVAGSRSSARSAEANSASRSDVTANSVMPIPPFGQVIFYAGHVTSKQQHTILNCKAGK